ncbi:hypothetical protein AIF0345_1565 [Actinomyces israelii]|nr:hypothetical protein AIF0345_1565 [Actinomyces israelii]
MSMPTSPANGWSPRAGYRRSAYPEVALSAGSRPLSVEWTPQVASARRRGRIATIVLSALGGVGLLAMLGVVYLSAMKSSQLATQRTWVAVALALVPLLIVLGTVWWIDRWEPEPPGVLVAAFLWGSGVAAVVSLVVNTSASLLVASSTGSHSGTELFSAVVSAPIVEESTKALGVLIIFLIWRRTFNGPVDGVVYACVVAAGFAFAENISYFVRYWDQIAATFLMRGILSPFVHVTFTACTGLAIGASARMRSSLAWIWMTPIGLACAIVLHAFWNGIVSQAFILYFLVEVPLFMAWVGVVVWLRWSERMTMRARLYDYHRAGWYSPAEITMLTTGSGRAAARRWARSQGPRALDAMRGFLKASAALAQLRQQALDGHAEADFAAQEASLLETMSSSRRIFTGQA